MSSLLNDKQHQLLISAISSTRRDMLYSSCCWNLTTNNTAIIVRTCVRACIHDKEGESKRGLKREYNLASDLHYAS
jgi:hypothetical protein